MSLLNNWQEMLSVTLRRRGWLLAAAGALALSGCAPIPAGPTEYSAGRTRVVLPSVAWEDLGATNEAFPFYPLPGSFPLQTRAVALRGTDRELLAVMLVQTNRSDIPRDPAHWTGGCPAQQDVTVEDAAERSPVRIDCLRLKRAASNGGWLEKNHPDLVRWMAQHKATPLRPVSHLNYRFATQGGSYVEVHVVVDQRLLQPKARTNEEFMRAGLPALEWSHKVAESARVSTGMADGFFPVPPFPFAVPN